MLPRSPRFPRHESSSLRGVSVERASDRPSLEPHPPLAAVHRPAPYHRPTRMSDQEHIPTETIAVPTQDPPKKNADEPVHAEAQKVREAGKDDKDAGDEMVRFSRGARRGEMLICV